MLGIRVVFKGDGYNLPLIFHLYYKHTLFLSGPPLADIYIFYIGYQARILEFTTQVGNYSFLIHSYTLELGGSWMKRLVSKKKW